MDRQKWTFWQEQGKWRGHPVGCPDRQIQAGSFDELQFRVQQLSQEVVKSSKEIPRIDPPATDNLSPPRLGTASRDTETAPYVLSQEQGKWRGHLRGYPNYVAQGESFDEVQFKLWKMYRDLTGGKSANLQKVA